MSIRLRSGGAFAARTTRRTRYVAILVDEVEEVVVALDGFFHQHLGFALARLRLLADAAVPVQVIKIGLVIALEVQLLHLFRHGFRPRWLDSPYAPARCPRTYLPLRPLCALRTDFAGCASFGPGSPAASTRRTIGPFILYLRSTIWPSSACTRRVKV